LIRVIVFRDKALIKAILPEIPFAAFRNFSRIIAVGMNFATDCRIHQIAQLVGKRAGTPNSNLQVVASSSRHQARFFVISATFVKSGGTSQAVFGDGFRCSVAALYRESANRHLSRKPYRAVIAIHTFIRKSVSNLHVDQRTSAFLSATILSPTKV